MKMLTLWQPWASLVAMGLKQNETRSWNTSYRGELAIHAAKRPVDKEGRHLWSEMHLLTGRQLPPVDDLPYGAIVAVCKLAACPSTDLVYETGLLQTEYLAGDWSSGRYAWMLLDVQPLAEPYPYRGAQGLVDLDYDTTQAVRKLLPATAPSRLAVLKRRNYALVTPDRSALKRKRWCCEQL